MQKTAFEAAQYITFQTPIGKRGDFLDAAKAAQYVKNKAGPMSWFTNYYFPFVQTPTNILGFTLERTPILQFALKRFRDDLKAGGARAEIAKARMALGAAFFIGSRYLLTPGDRLIWSATVIHFPPVFIRLNPSKRAGPFNISPTGVSSNIFFGFPANGFATSTILPFLSNIT